MNYVIVFTHSIAKYLQVFANLHIFMSKYLKIFKYFFVFSSN